MATRRTKTNSGSTSTSTSTSNASRSFPSTASITSSKRDRPAHSPSHSHSHSQSCSFPSDAASESSVPSSSRPLSSTVTSFAAATANGLGYSHHSAAPAAVAATNVAALHGRPLPKKQKRVRSQYPPNSGEKHVEYILVASFDIDRGSIMEHQYPRPVGGDEHMLAELMLPDQTHLRSQDWTIFFLHKDAEVDEEGAAGRKSGRRKKKGRRKGGVGVDGDAVGGAEKVVLEGGVEGDDDNGNGNEAEDEVEEEAESDGTTSDSDAEQDGVDGPPLVYVLNLVNTKQDNTVKRGAIVKAMAICTPHSFLHIYKPLLLLALEQYFLNPVIETLASLYDAVNTMDLSLMPRLSPNERFILQSIDAKDLFLDKFEAMIAQRMAENPSSTTIIPPSTSPSTHTTHPNLHHTTANAPRYGLPRDTHEFESIVHYAHVPAPVKVPVALSPETVGDFSLIKLITTFSQPHATAPQPFTPLHPHLTTSGPLTPPIIVLLNALLTQKRVIFLGHNQPSSSVADAVLAACALASGGLLRGFTRHAFPYTDLSKIDDLLKVPGFIAGVTNPAFAHKPEWWDLLCDLGTGRMRISPKIEPAARTEGVAFFQQAQMQNGHASAGSGGMPSTPGISSGGSAGVGGIAAIAAAGASLSAGLGGPVTPSGASGDATGDMAFMQSVLAAIHDRHGENAIRGKFRRWVLKFTRLAAAFEEWVFGASALQVSSPNPAFSPASSSGGGGDLVNPTTPSSLNGGTNHDPTGPTEQEPDFPPDVLGHGYVWPSTALKQSELAANAARLDAWRSTRSYYHYVQDLALSYTHRPVRALDLQHLHDRLAKLRLSPDASAQLYLAVCKAVRSEEEVCQLLAVVVTGTGNAGEAAGGMAGGGGLFYLGLGLLHPRREVREAVARLLGRVREHEAGEVFWRGVGRFVGRAMERVSDGMLQREERGEL